MGNSGKTKAAGQKKESLSGKCVKAKKNQEREIGQGREKNRKRAFAQVPARGGVEGPREVSREKWERRGVLREKISPTNEKTGIPRKGRGRVVLWRERDKGLGNAQREGRKDMCSQ